MDIISCRIMILNIHLGLHGSSGMAMMFIGGRRFQNSFANPIENMLHELKEYIRREINSRRIKNLFQELRVSGKPSLRRNVLNILLHFYL